MYEPARRVGDDLRFLEQMLLGLALAILFLKPAALPRWLRWLTLAAIAAFAGLAFSPFILVLLWAVVVGVWLLIGAGRRSRS